MTYDEKAVRQLVETWMAASRSGDVATVLTLMTDDVVFMVPGQEPFGREAFAVASEGMRDVQVDGTSEILELKVLGDWAFLRSRIDITATPLGGIPVHRSHHPPQGGRWSVAAGTRC